ncbi:MAG: phage-shock protein, partial [Pelotomaculum sp.]
INAKKKKVKKLFSEEAMLISDGRFIQMDNGLWGLTEWEVETSHYSLKNLVIKAMKIHPGGLSAQQLYQLLNTWRETDYKTMENILNKFPYFEMVGEGIWSYNPNVRVVYETIQKKFVSLIEKQKSRWHRDRNNWKNKFVLLQKKLEESMAGQREAAAALAEKIELNSQQDYLLSQMAEKDLLLSLRKKEIFRYREHLNKLESKANSILHQCRLWVKRTRDAQAEIDRLKDLLAKNQSGMEGLFSKLQQYKEKDRVNKMTIAEIKEQYSTKIAALQREIVELKQKNERLREMSAIEEYNLKEQINSLSSDLKKSLRMEEEQQRSLRQAQQELSAVKEAYIKLESRLNNPLIKLIIKICALIEGKHAKTTL